MSRQPSIFLFRATAEQALEKVILDLRENGVGKHKEGKDAVGGAVVVQQVKTGEVLACASYPTFNLSTYSEDITELSQDETSPASQPRAARSVSPRIHL